MCAESTTVGPALEVAIEKMVYGGEGLARTPEGVLLVPRVIAGERVTALPETARRGVRRGQLLEVVEHSPERISAPCPYYARCGGCQYQHISYSRQLQTKEQVLLECFERVGKFQIHVPIQTIPSEPFGYRNRVRLQVEKRPDGFRVGYREHSSHTLVPVEACPIAFPAIQETIGSLAGGVLTEAFPDGDAEVELFSSETGASLLATVYSPLTAPAEFGDIWRTALPAFESVAWLQTDAHRDPTHIKQTNWGNGAITYRVGEYHYRVSHESFFQANGLLLARMVEAAMGDLSGARALDLYAGVGFFTLPLARRFERVAAVEAHPASARDLAANAGVMGTRVQVHRKPVEQFLAATSHNWDAVLVDPPRAGLTKPALEGLARLRAPRVVYISCDPTTLARDLAKLLAADYEIVSVHLVDQFPQSFHIETIVHLATTRR